MPKLLRKELMEDSKYTFLLAAIALSIFVVMTMLGRHSGGQFGAINLFLVYFLPASQTFSGVYILPQFMFIAPVSREGREKLIGRAIKEKLLLNLGIYFLVLVLPIFLYDCYMNEYFYAFICILELVFIIICLIYGAYGRYIYRVNLGKWIGLELALIFIYAIFSAILEDKYPNVSNSFIATLGAYKNDVKWVLICLSIGVILSVYIVAKFRKDMISFMANYEASRDLKTNLTILGKE